MLPEVELPEVPDHRHGKMVRRRLVERPGEGHAVVRRLRERQRAALTPE
jgi:hypothetical protein